MEKADKKLIARIEKNDRAVLDKLYVTYRDPFFNYFKKYQISDEDIKDIYQDTMIAFYQNGVRGRLTNLSSSIKTYIFGIGKHKAIDFIRSKSKSADLPQVEQGEFEEIEIEKVSMTLEQEKLYKHFFELGESCRKMLKYFYYRGLSISEIVKIGAYKDANTVKSHKSRCLKQLRSLVNK